MVIKLNSVGGLSKKEVISFKKCVDTAKKVCYTMYQVLIALYRHPAVSVFMKGRFVMKKIACAMIACLLVFASMGVSVFAAPADDIVAAAKENIPAKYEEDYLVSLENVLAAVSVSQEQADGVVECIETAAAAIEKDKGSSLSNYTAEEREAIMKHFAKACEILGLTYKVETTDKYHKGDVCVRVYYNGEEVGTFDNDVVKKTDADGVSMMWYALAAVALSAALIVAAGLSKKALAARS